MIDFKKYALFLAAAALMMAGCKSAEGEKTLPGVSGKAGEVAVVCSKVEWEGEPGTTLRAILSDEMPYLPQVEPLYDLFNVPPQAFNILEHRFVNAGPGAPVCFAAEKQ